MGKLLAVILARVVLFLRQIGHLLIVDKVSCKSGKVARLFATFTMASMVFGAYGCSCIWCCVVLLAEVQCGWQYFMRACSHCSVCFVGSTACAYMLTMLADASVFEWPAAAPGWDCGLCTLVVGRHCEPRLAGIVSQGLRRQTCK